MSPHRLLPSLQDRCNKLFRQTSAVPTLPQTEFLVLATEVATARAIGELFTGLTSATPLARPRVGGLSYRRATRRLGGTANGTQWGVCWRSNFRAVLLSGYGGTRNHRIGGRVKRPDPRSNDSSRPLVTLATFSGMHAYATGMDASRDASSIPKRKHPKLS
jgi:hypothetical protein